MPGDLILVVDDEENIQDISRMYLEQEGYEVRGIDDGVEAVNAARTLNAALMVLDIMLPGMDGFAVCHTLRKENNPIPIIILTARDEDADKIMGLELGADDYVIKPFNPHELVARVKAILRREDYQNHPLQGVLQVGDMELDLDQHTVRIAHEPAYLRTQEFEVLRVLAENPGRVFKREQLLNLAWGFDFYGQTRTVDMHIAQIRRKIVKSKVRIETVIGIGYKLIS
ncbi:MAG TPA: DNA-binding response regulator [Anaerolineaceae bacterium]|uniref:OmpR family two-component response regulator n=1 Tax=Anaerolinea thermophila TaxID=167964 RepID=A0A101FWY7_9CHLR|nr:MAG: OmpR family two-component response regulator [Anaerolinea thermophila]HAF62309.1 DNA-binding response regulator [Anaerolineaceae bacterium]